MTPEQVAKILTFLTAVDSRVKAPAPPRKVNGTWIVDPTVTAWQAVFARNRVRFEDAWEGVQELASEPMIQVPQVGHVVAAATRRRAVTRSGCGRHVMRSWTAMKLMRR